MSSRSRQTVRGAKTTPKGGKGKAARRPPVKSATDVPILAVVVGAILLVLFAGLVVYAAINNRSTSVPSVQGSTTSIPCDALERTQVHYHVALQIMDSDGTLHPIPAGVGIIPSETTPTCFYWLHVHGANQDVVHIESPAQDVFSLGDFFKVWNAYNSYLGNGQGQERLDRTHVSTLSVGTGQEMVVYIDNGDGKGPQVFDGDPTTITLKAHEVITIEIVNNGKTITPPSFDWNSASNKGL